MPTDAKKVTIEELTQKLRDSKGAVMLDYRGLNVSAIQALRRQLSAEGVDFHVTKNTLLRIAAEQAQVDLSPDLISGPTAVAFGLNDEATPARLLAEYTRRNRTVSIKGGLVGGRSMSAAQMGRVAELPSREILLSQLLGAFQAPMAQTLAVLQAPAREIAGLAQALADKMAASAEA